VPEIVGDSSKLRQRTGWRAEIPLATSLRDTLDYWRHKLARPRERKRRWVFERF